MKSIEFKNNKLTLSFSLWGWLLILTVAALSLVAYEECIPQLVTQLQTSKLEYNIDILIDDGMTKEEWMHNEHLNYHGNMHEGSRYYKTSKSWALDAAETFDQYDAIRYSGNSRSYPEFQQFAPFIFECQCEFDSINGYLFSYRDEELTNKWFLFLKTKIEQEDNDHRIRYTEAFEKAFDWVYR